jgi:pyridoxine kinase
MSSPLRQIFFFPLMAYLTERGGIAILKNMTVPRVLTIAGSDALSGGGAQTDLTTFSEYGAFGFAALTALVTCEDDDYTVNPLAAELLEAQLAAPLKEYTEKRLAAIKTGLLPDEETVYIAASFARECPEAALVVDPVLVFKEMDDREAARVKNVLVKELLPRSLVVTPNLEEARILSGRETLETEKDRQEAAQIIFSYGPQNVLIKGGSRVKGDDALDLLYDGHEFITLKAPKIAAGTVNGAGCALSAAITAQIAWGRSLKEAVVDAKEFVREALENGLVTEQGGSVWPAARRLRKRGSSRA